MKSLKPVSSIISILKYIYIYIKNSELKGKRKKKNQIHKRI
jgi:hypothetical protein